jgi:hypothetical protein
MGLFSNLLNFLGLLLFQTKRHFYCSSEYFFLGVEGISQIVKMLVKIALLSFIVVVILLRG